MMRRDSLPVRCLLLALLLCVLTLTAGCRGLPLFNILGSFFPAWMVCLAIGVVLTLFLRWLFQRTGFERDIHPLVVIYPALVTFFTCTIWLLWFS